MDESSRRVPCGIESDTWSPGWEEEHLRSVGSPQGAPAGGAGQSSGDPGGGAGALLSGRLGYISIPSRNDNGSPKIALLNKNSRNHQIFFYILAKIIQHCSQVPTVGRGVRSPALHLTMAQVFRGWQEQEQEVVALPWCDSVILDSLYTCCNPFHWSRLCVTG